MTRFSSSCQGSREAKTWFFLWFPTPCMWTGVWSLILLSIFILSTFKSIKTLDEKWKKVRKDIVWFWFMRGPEIKYECQGSLRWLKLCNGQEQQRIRRHGDIYWRKLSFCSLFLVWYSKQSLIIICRYKKTKTSLGLHILYNVYFCVCLCIF